MSGPELEDVRDRIDQEGFDYTFCHYSDFSEIHDDRFHGLRKAYVDAAIAFKTYLGVD